MPFSTGHKASFASFEIGLTEVRLQRRRRIAQQWGNWQARTSLPPPCGAPVERWPGSGGNRSLRRTSRLPIALQNENNQPSARNRTDAPRIL
jgi:hypothetical protein